jgi:hypothetical protein
MLRKPSAPVKLLDVKSWPHFFARFFPHFQNGNLTNFVGNSLPRPRTVSAKTKQNSVSQKMLLASNGAVILPQHFAGGFVGVLGCVVHHVLHALLHAPAESMQA